MINYLHFTDYGMYLSMMAHGVAADIAHGAAERTAKVQEVPRTAIANHNGTYLHLGLIQVCEGAAPEWLTLCSPHPTQPRIPSQWIVLRWAESAGEIDDDPANYLGVFDEYEFF